MAVVVEISVKKQSGCENWSKNARTKNQCFAPRSWIRYFCTELIVATRKNWCNRIRRNWGSKPKS